MPNLLDAIEQRWQRQFAALAAGDDVTPSERLRTEGMMESAVLLELATDVEIQSAMARNYEEVFGGSLAAEYGAQWAALFPFPQIPAMGKRAPVFPSTKD